VAKYNEGRATGDNPDRKGLRYLQTPFVVDGKAKSPQIDLELLPVRPKEALRPYDDLPLTLRGFYRGRDLTTVQTTVRVHHWPDVSVYNRPPPESATLAVQAEPGIFDRYAVGRSHVVFIIDYSGSMKGDKIEQAKAAFRDAVRTIPPGVTVTLLTYAQEVPGLDDKTRKESYHWVHVLWDGVVWEDDEPRIAALMDQLKPLKPDGNTPLLAAMWVAEERLKNFNGVKTIIVLTDGADTSFLRNAKVDLRKDGKSVLGREPFNLRQGNESIPQFMVRTFGRVQPGRKSDIRLSVIGFGLELDTQEERESYQAFKEGLEQIGAPPIVTTNTRDELRKELQKAALQQLQFRLDVEGGFFFSGKRGLRDCDVSRIKVDNPRWLEEDLGDGTFNLTLQTSPLLSAGVKQRLRVSPGDNQLLELQYTLRPRR
jgi:hypothetical protein